MGAREPKPFPWQALPRVDRRTTAAIDALAAWARARPRSIELAVPSGAVRARAGNIEVLAGAALAGALADPTSAVVVVRARARLGAAAYVVAGGALCRSLAAAILGGADELDAPRAPTPAERGVVAYAVAAALDAAGAQAFAEPSESAGPLLAAELREAAVVELELDGACAGWAVAVVPLALLAAAPPPRAWRGASAAWPAWIDEPAVVAHVAIGAARLSRARAQALAARDVVVFARGASLRLGKGGVAGALAPAGGGFIVSGHYRRGPMDDSEMLGDDETVEVTACAGAVSLSVRRVLELQPGQVLALGRATGGAVELRVGRQLLGRGELVDVDGELGVRVLSVETRGESGRTAP